MDCIFCKIGNGDFNTEFLYESENIVAFRDINPVAPIHVLIIPKKHIESISTIEDKDLNIVAEIMKTIKQLAINEKIDGSGYRVFSNCGKDGGQEVNHLHFHLIGGKKLENCW